MSFKTFLLYFKNLEKFLYYNNVENGIRLSIFFKEVFTQSLGKIDKIIFLTVFIIWLSFNPSNLFYKIITVLDNDELYIMLNQIYFQLNARKW